MLTIKYRMTDGAEVIESGFTLVGYNIGQFSRRPDLPDDHPENKDSEGRDTKLLRGVVTGHLPDGRIVTYGPVIYMPDEAPCIEPVVWVMNDGGATVAKYSLL